MKSLVIASAVLATSIVCAPASADLMLQYKYDEGAGSTTADTGTGTAANGSLVGAGWTTNTPSGTGAALDLSGATAESLRYVVGGDAEKLDSLSQFTLSTWVNLQEAPTGNRRILAKQAPSADGFTWNVSNAGNGSPRSAAAFSTRLFIGGSNGFLFDPIPTDPTYVIDADNKWVFLAVTYDGSLAQGNAKYYVGSPTSPVTLLATTTIGTVGSATGGTTNNSDAQFGVGYTDAAPANNLTLPGFVDDSRVYNNVLALNELEAVRTENLFVPTLPGDYNGDGFVGQDDLNLVLGNWGQTVTPGKLNGDGSGDGFVGQDDLNQILGSWGQGGAAAAALTAVPEPATLSLLGLGALATLARRRRA